MPTHTQLKGIRKVGDSLLSDQLEANLISFFNWGLLGVGGFYNVAIPTSGCYGGDQSRLRRVSDPNYTDGQVWETFRKDWVWESGVEHPVQPIRVSGVFVNGGFQPITATGTYAHHYDYPNGRVVFDTAIPTSSVLTCEYSYRLYQVTSADTNWWRAIQANSFRVDSTQFLQVASGAWDTLSQNRMQLPAVVVEAVPRSERYGLELGNLRQVVRQDVLFHILSEDRWNYKWLHDAITCQQEKRIQGFDKNRLLDDDAFPLDADGSPRPSGLMYPSMVKASGEGGYFWEQIRMIKFRGQDQESIGPFRYATIRGTIEVDVS